MTDAVQTTPKKRLALHPKQAVPVLLALFVFSLVMDNGFKLMSPSIASSLGLSENTVSLQATLPGILIGVGAVVYAALSDSISIRKLMIFAVIVMAAGSLLGFALRGSFSGVLAGRILQTCGLAAAETLYVIWVTKHFEGDEQKKYLGYSTAAFQLSLLLGAVGSGFIATYVGWTAFFLVNLVALVTIPFILKYVPAEDAGETHLDVFGLFLVAVIATGIVLFMQDFNWWFMLPAAAAAAVFVWHISVHPNALITKDFFANKRYTMMLVVVFVVYSVQLGYQFIFPFIIKGIYGWKLSDVALLLVPGYTAAVIVGALSGRIARRLSSKQAIVTAMIMITLALVIPAFLVGGWVGSFAISMVLFGSGFALMYAPLLSTAIRDVPKAKGGIAIGFYNLTINMAVPIGIAYSAKLLNLGLSLTSFTGQSPKEASYGSVLLILAIISVFALLLYRISIRVLEREDAHARTA
ncbi:MAG: MFS transporter [Mycobacterium sp.]|nr:MFS transporter [Mycobacterium sp.]